MLANTFREHDQTQTQVFLGEVHHVFMLREKKKHLLDDQRVCDLCFSLSSITKDVSRVSFGHLDSPRLWTYTFK